MRKLYTSFSGVLLISAFLYLNVNVVYSHDLKITGVVYDLADGLPLPGATVLILETGEGTITDEFGKFTLSSVQHGIYSLKINYLGYETVEVKASAGSHIKTGLKQSALDLSEVRVTAINAEALNVISSIDIKLRPFSNSQEILRIVPGLFIAQHAGGGKAEQIFMRGFDIDHGTDISIDVDGVPVNMVSHAHGQGYADLHFLIPEVVERVKWGKGPYETSVGDFATAGYVSFATKDALDKSMVKLEGGMFDTWRGVALLDLLNHGEGMHAHNAYLASEFNYTNGPFNSPQNFHRLNIFGKYHGIIDSTRFLTFSASTFSSRWDASGQVPQRAVDAGIIDYFGAIDDTEGGQTSRSNLNLRYTKILSDKSILKNQVYFSGYDFELFSNFTFFLDDSLNGDQIVQREKRKLYGYNLSYERKGKLFSKLDVLTTLGAFVRYDDVNGNELSHTRDREVVLERRAVGDIDQVNSGIHAGQSIYLNRLKINTGLRLDYFNFSYLDKLDSSGLRKNQDQLVASPKLNFFYTISSKMQAFLKTGIGFHSNDTRVAVEYQDEKVIPRAYGADLGATIKLHKRILVQPVLWYLFLEQEFIYVGDEGIVEPSGRTQRLGADLSVRLQITKWLFADADFNYTYARAVDEPAGENHIPLAPIFTNIGGITWKHESGFNGSLRYRHIADRAANEDYTITATGYTVVDAELNFTKPKYELSLTVQNIFNVRWNEAQFATRSLLRNESAPVTELHFTPGYPFFFKAGISRFF